MNQCPHGDSAGRCVVCDLSEHQRLVVLCAYSGSANRWLSRSHTVAVRPRYKTVGHATLCALERMGVMVLATLSGDRLAGKLTARGREAGSYLQMRASEKVKSKPIGRPPNPEARRTKRVELRLHPEELRQLRAKADKAGVTVAEYVRSACGLALDRIPT